MDAREHRSRAEHHLATARRMRADMTGQVTAADVTNELLAAQAHAALYLGDQFATEFDPRSTVDEARPVVPVRSIGRINPGGGA